MIDAEMIAHRASSFVFSSSFFEAIKNDLLFGKIVKENAVRQ